MPYNVLGTGDIVITINSVVLDFQELIVWWFQGHWPSQNDLWETRQTHNTTAQMME